MTRSQALRSEARAKLAGAWDELKASARELGAAGDALLVGNLVGYERHLADGARYTRWARELRAEAKELVREARAFDARRCCCAVGPNRAVCMKPVGHEDGIHQEGRDTWAA